jgi:NRPS condensation-like uncharacterized protein
VEAEAMDYSAEIFDQVQRLFDVCGLNDHQLHCVLRFESAPDADLLKRAFLASIAAIPILGTHYLDGGRPHWTSIEPDRCAEAFSRADTEAEFEDFLVARSDEDRGPQVRLCLLATGPGAVGLTLNHMICDGAAFKDYLYFLCGTYSAMAKDPTYRPPAIAGDRNIRAVLARFGIGARLRSLMARRGGDNRAGDHRFPLSEGGEARPFIVTRKLERERTAALRRYCHAHSATLNDAVLAAYYRCLARALGSGAGTLLSIPVMVDMRRFLGESAEFTALTNLSSMVATELECRPAEGFADTLGRVKAEMDAKKGGEIGLNAFAKLDLLFRLCGDRIANRAIRSNLEYPQICMTNLGILDEARLSFGGLRPSDAFVCGSIKYRPYFQVAMSSYAGEVTLSVNLYGGAGDRERIVAFLDGIAAELAG